MTVYVAASWYAREYVRRVTAALRANGIDCTNNWMDREAFTPGEKVACALSDLSEVQAAEAVLLLNEQESSAGGMHFESGYAFAKGKRLMIVGRGQSVFHFLPGIEAFGTIQDFIAIYGIKKDCGCGAAQVTI